MVYLPFTGTDVILLKADSVSFKALGKIGALTGILLCLRYSAFNTNAPIVFDQVCACH